MKLMGVMDLVSSGLSAQRTRMEVASGNLANAQTTRTEEGGPYRRRDVVLAAVETAEGVGVRVEDVVSDTSEPRREYDPHHPDADPDGFVAYPNVSTIEEMVSMITASRAYEAGVTALNTAVSMAQRALDIGR